MRTPIARAVALTLLVACDQSGEAVAQPDRTQAVTQTEVAAAAGETAPPPEQLPPDEPREEDVVDPEAPAEPEVPQAPSDYGLIKPPIDPPSEEALTLHGAAGYEVVAVYAKPDIEAPRLGYLRLGSRLQVTEKVEGTGCPKGWHALPNGGFACASKGLVVADKPPFLNDPPPLPDRSKALPYEYAYVRKWNTPMFWRVPTPDEQKAADERRALLEAQREGRPPPGEGESKEAGETKTVAWADGGVDPAFSELPKPAESPPTKPAPAATPKAEPADDAIEATPVDAAKLPLNPQHPWLEKGFFISIGDKVHDEGRTWWRTARGAYIPAGDAYKYGPKDFVGVEIGEETDFPFGWAMSKETKVYALDDAGKLKVTGKIERRTFLDFTEETEVGGKAYMMTTDGTLVRKDDVRIAERQALPKGLQPWERWIDVSLEQQMLVAYEGERPVYVTLVSTGRKGTKEEPFETPTGRWRIRSKHISTTMDGNTASDGNYSIQDVPWAMFFDGSYALHGAFWHESFGRVRSHGCVNLGPSDARWLFHWTTPFLPEGWHGVHAHEGSPGTTVIIRP